MVLLFLGTAMQHSSLALFIQHSPFTSTHQSSALSLLEAWTAAKKPVARVFFYQDAVLTANVGLKSSSTLVGEFLKLSKKHQFPLQVCVASAHRRGLIDEAQAKKQDTQATLNQDFELVGLGELAEAALNNEKIVSF